MNNGLKKKKQRSTKYCKIFHVLFKGKYSKSKKEWHGKKLLRKQKINTKTVGY